MSFEDAIKCGNNAIRKYPEFLRFLKENGVYTEWLENRADFLKRGSKTRDWTFIYENTIKIKQEHLLMSFQTSFPWHSSKQGYVYWKKLNDKYFIFLRRYGDK